MRRRGLWAVTVVLLVMPITGGASPAATSGIAVEAPQSIRAAIDDALKPRLGTLKDATAEIGAIDPRLRLPSCPALEVALPAASGAAIAAKVDCPAPNWTIYVPVRLHAWAEAVVAAANLAPETKLTPDLLTRGRTDLFAASGGVVTDPARVEGKILRVGVTAGSPILASYVAMPIAVHRGQAVLLTVSDGAMTIRNSLLALEDGRVGDNIALKNPQSQKTIHATVSGDGSAEIRF